MERLRGAEGQHHQGVLGDEPEDDGHHRQHVLGAAGGQGHRVVAHAQHRPRAGWRPHRGRGGLWRGRPGDGRVRVGRAVGGAGYVAPHACRRVRAAPGPRRVLRRCRAARQAVSARQAGRGRRRRRPGRGGHRVVRSAPVRRALGDVDARGPVPVPARRVPQRPVPRLPGGQRAGDGAAARALPARGAAVPGRGVRRPGPRRPSRPERGDRDPGRRGAARRHPRGHRRADRLGGRRRRRSSSPRSPASWTSPTGWWWSRPAPRSSCSGPCT